MLKDRPYSVPEGYFDDLQSKLSEIPDMPGREVSGWQKFQPYLALAACFCFALVAGTFLKKNTENLPEAPDTIYEQLIYSDLIPHSEPASIFDPEQTTAYEDMESEDDIIAYLIETGTSIYLIDFLSQ